MTRNSMYDALYRSTLEEFRSAFEPTLWDRFLAFGPTNPPIMNMERCLARARLGHADGIKQLADFEAFKAYVRLTGRS